MNPIMNTGTYMRIFLEMCICKDNIVNIFVFNQIRVKNESLHYAYLGGHVPYQHWPLIGHVTLILSAHLPRVSHSALVRAGSGQLIFTIEQASICSRLDRDWTEIVSFHSSLICSQYLCADVSTLPLPKLPCSVTVVFLLMSATFVLPKMKSGHFICLRYFLTLKWKQTIRAIQVAATL